MARPKGGMRLKAIHRIEAGENGVLEPGTVFPCPGEEAERLIALGAAVEHVEEEGTES